MTKQHGDGTLVLLDESYRVSRALSIMVCVLMPVMSFLGMVFPNVFYPSRVLQEQFLANDLINLMVGLPLLFASLVNNDPLLGTLLLPGALLYVIYNYIAFALGRPWDLIAVMGLVLVVLSSMALILALKSVSHVAIKQRLEGRVAERVTGSILAMFGILFIGLAISTLFSNDNRENTQGKKAVAVSDIFISLALVRGGILLVSKKPLGYSMGLGLLVVVNCLFVGLVIYFFIAPLVSERPLDWAEVTTVTSMGVVSFIPTAFFWRGVAATVREQKTL